MSSPNRNRPSWLARTVLPPAYPEQVDILHDQLVPGNAAMLLVNIALYQSLAPVVPAATLAVWLAAATIIALVRGGTGLAYKYGRREGRDPNAWLRLFYFLLLGHGVVLGSAVWVIFPPTASEQFLVIIIIIGIAAGSAVVLIAHPPSAAAFVGLLLAPLAAKFFVSDDYPAVYGIMTIFLGLLVIKASMDFSRILLNAIDLREEKERYIRRNEEAEQALRTRDSWLRAIIDNAPMEIVLKDVDGRIMLIGGNIARTLGLTPESMIGHVTSDYISDPETAERYQKADREVVATGKPLQQEVVETWTGERRHVLNSKFPLRGDDREIMGVCSLTTDITEMKNIEAQLHHAQKREAVVQLTGGIAPDFNNLLAVIVGNLDILADRIGASDREEKAIRLALGAAEKGATLTRQLLIFARRQTLEPRPLDVKALVTGMEEILRRTLGEEIAVDILIRDDLWPALADAGQLENALLNLVLNARDAMPEGGRLVVRAENETVDELTASEYTEFAPGDYVVLSVTDTGTGIEAENLSRVFEPFFTTKEFGAGSGLGLSMVFGFAKKSGGHVEIDSRPGHGTWVKLFLPHSATGAAPAVKEESRPALAGRKETILLVEDDPDVREMTLSMLEALNYRVIAAADAAAAISAMEKAGPVDLVLSDIVLPGAMRGPALVRHLRDRWPDQRVLFMSGYAEVATSDDSLDADADLLAKPFRKRELADRVRAALNR